MNLSIAIAHAPPFRRSTLHANGQLGLHSVQPGTKLLFVKIALHIPPSSLFGVITPSAGTLGVLPWPAVQRRLRLTSLAACADTSRCGLRVPRENYVLVVCLGARSRTTRGLCAPEVILAPGRHSVVRRVLYQQDAPLRLRHLAMVERMPVPPSQFVPHLSLNFFPGMPRVIYALGGARNPGLGIPIGLSLVLQNLCLSIEAREIFFFYSV